MYNIILILYVVMPTDSNMAASSRPVFHSTSPKNRGWFSSGGRKLHIIPSKSSIAPNDEEVISSSPTKKMRQVGKSKSEKEKMKIYASSQDLGLRSTKWHISLPNIPNTQDATPSDGASASPKRNIASPLPPPPSNPPPILNQASDSSLYSSEGRSLVKSVSAGAINIVSTARPVGKPQGMVRPVTTNNTDDKLMDINGRPRKGPPPKLPPPYSAKARAVTVISAATQDHPQSSTRSAPGELQKNNESEHSTKLTASDRFTSSSTEVRSETIVVVEPIPVQPLQKPIDPPAPTVDSESQLTASMGGGVKSLARYFSARSKEGVTTTKLPPSPKQANVLRPDRGRQNFKSVLQKASSIPETCKEERETSVGKSKFRRLPPIHSITDDSDEKYEILQNVGSMVSSGSPTHMSIFSWYNPAPHSKPETGDVSKRRYQNVFDDESFACFDKTGHAKKDKESSTSPKYPYKEYMNILVETATLEETPSSVPSPKEGSYKDKKPIPLPRTQSKDRGMAPQIIRGRHLVTSSSEGSLPLSIAHPGSENRNSEYVDMAKELEYSIEAVKENVERAKEAPPESPGIIVLGAMDPEWREKYEELLEREIEMVEGFSDWDEPTEDMDGSEQLTADASGDNPVSTSPPFAPAKKSLLKKTQSHNPNEPNICRRNTPKEKRELRKGVCSDSDQLGINEGLDIDDYVPMQPAQSPESVNNTPLPSLATSTAHSEMTSSPSAPKPAPGMDLESSAGYLEILPSPPLMVKPAEESVKVTPTPIKHYYIEIDIPEDKSDEKKLKQGLKGAGSSPTPPPKSSPTHTTGRVVEVTPKGKRKLKYRRVDVVPATQPSSTSDTKRKIPYSRVKVDSNTEPSSSGSPNSHAALEKQPTQGLIFPREMLDRPLPPTPSEEAIYYRTVNHPLGPVSGIRQVRHQYIEIDEEELNKRCVAPLPGPSEGWINIHAAGGPVRVHKTKPRSQTTLPPAPPPPVPRRPSCPYVEIDGKELSEMAESVLDVDATGGLRPRPPRLLNPGRQDNAGRQRSFSSSGEYAYPLIPGLKLEWINVHKNGEKAYFTPRAPLPVSSHGPHQNASGGKSSLMETITERSEASSDQPPSLPPKTESLLREQQGLTFAKPSPYLVPVTSAKPSATKPRKLSAPAIFCHSLIPLPPPESKRPQSPKDVTMKEDERREEGEVERRERTSALPSHLLQKKKSMKPPRQPLPYHMSAEMKGHPPKIPKKKGKVSSEDGNSVSPTPMADSKSGDRDLGGSPKNATKKLPPSMITIRKPRLQHRIDRNSLAMIMRNKSAIAKQLEKASDSPKSQRKQIFASKASETERDVSVVRSLGDILLDVDALLQQRMCTEDDVIAAIEQQLHIKLVRKKEGGNGSSRSDAADRKRSDGSALEDSVQVTEQDVQEVVTFMNKSQDKHLTPKESPSDTLSVSGAEDGDGWMGSSVVVKNGPQESVILSPTKDRSSTFIVTQSQQAYTEESAVQPHTQGPAPLSPYDRLAPTTDKGSRDEGEDGCCEESPKNMRDSRSSSVGLKPLRRVKGVKDRRRTNPASGMANLGSGKLNA